MLVNVKLNKYDDDRMLKLREEHKDDPSFINYFDWRRATNRLLPQRTGIYFDYGLNFSIEMVERLSYDDEYPVLGEVTEFSLGEKTSLIGSLSPYGVSDTVEQVLKLYEDDLENPDRKFCISFTPIVKADQPQDGGWRWHKWGSYIGTHVPEYEYLYDEKDIEQVLIYHIYEIPDSLVLVDKL